MPRSLFFKEVAPFLAMFALLLVLTTLIDILLHHYNLVWVGRYLGIPGTLLILFSFVYSLRKRKHIQTGSPRFWLRYHQTLTWTGSLMVLVHAGIHVYALLPWLALIAMMVNIISGMTGQFLLGRSRQFVAVKRADYAARGLTETEIDRKLFWDATTVELMKKWRAVHLPITLAFAVLSMAHILSIFLFWQWK